MRHVGELITVIREQTDNRNYGDAEGISQEEFVELLNDAQTNIFLRILAEVPDTSIFDASEDSSLIEGTRAYGTSARWGIKNAIRFVEYSPTGSEIDFYFLEPRSIKELTRYQSMYPSCYTVQNGFVLISPVPSSAQGTLRITYVKRPDRLDLRRGKVDATTGTYSTIVLETSPSPDEKLTDSENLPYYVCTSDAFGTVTFQNALVTAYDAATLTMTVTATSASGTISEGDWVTFGSYTATHSTLPEEFERYLIAYTTVEILKRDSSKDAGDWNAKLRDIEQNLISLAQNSIREQKEIPITNDFYTV